MDSTMGISPGMGVEAGIIASVMAFSTFIMIFSLISYIVGGLTYMKVGDYNDVKYPWLAWIPIANIYVIYSVGRELSEHSNKDYAKKFIIGIICSIAFYFIGMGFLASSKLVLLGMLLVLGGIVAILYTIVLLYYPLISEYFVHGKLFTALSILIPFILTILFIIILVKGVENTVYEYDE